MISANYINHWDGLQWQPMIDVNTLSEPVGRQAFLLDQPISTYTNIFIASIYKRTAPKGPEINTAFILNGHHYNLAL